MWATCAAWSADATAAGGNDVETAPSTLSRCGEGIKRGAACRVGHDPGDQIRRHLGVLVVS
eukprot:972215-Pyramimonas_sp.AAC.1